MFGEEDRVFRELVGAGVWIVSFVCVFIFIFILSSLLLPAPSSHEVVVVGSGNVELK